MTPSAQPLHRRSWRLAGGIALALVLALAFLGYLTPDMRVQWANFVALCGF
ncbi:hypothetical protein [Paracandidimonas lactea]|uniref:hypothetical protein n=1 Tax=Paracandidimonas lactea TaxID=2895524 RepID=UPI001928F8AD|nr:hypothetical protein [Paracandidimonas lactea]